jgi:hypothetical protein
MIYSPLIPGSEAAAAKDQIMVVKNNPPSLGYLRLQTQCETYADLGTFLNIHGAPDFLAETGTRKRRFFILYYLEQRKAYACRTQITNPSLIQFAGPYPITAREHQILSNHRDGHTEKPLQSSAR